MVTTTNKFLEKPARGSLSGVWDTPVNANMDIIDSSFGGVATIPLLSTNVTLSTSQAQCMMLRFTGAITTHIAIIFPAIGGTWTIINDCTNVSTYVVYAYNGSSGQYIGLPPGVTDIMGDGTSMKFRSLPPIGSYMLLAGNSYQPWMTFASPQLPYLNCDGSAVPGTYTQLIQMIGGSLPDFRGRAFYTTDQGTGRLTGVIGSGYTAAGGDQYLMSHSHTYSNSVFVSFNVNSSTSLQDINHTHTFTAGFPIGQCPFSGGNPQCTSGTGTTSGPNFDINAHQHNVGAGMSGGFSGSTSGAGSGGWQNMPPCIIGGLTFIRSGA